MADTLTHLALIVCWMLGTVGWGESLETACERFSLSASTATERGGYLHTAFLWLYFAIVAWQLSREVRGRGARGGRTASGLQGRELCVLVLFT